MVQYVFYYPILSLTIEQVCQDGIALFGKYGVYGTDLNLETVEKGFGDRLIRFMAASPAGGNLCQCLQAGEVLDRVLVQQQLRQSNFVKSH